MHQMILSLVVLAGAVCGAAAGVLASAASRRSLESLGHSLGQLQGHQLQGHQLQGHEEHHVQEHHEEGKPYKFGYGVKDAHQGLDFNQQEASDGHVVTGQYRVQLPDGRTQVVTYTADWKNGYHANVQYEGEASHPKVVAAPHGWASGASGSEHLSSGSLSSGSLSSGSLSGGSLGGEYHSLASQLPLSSGVSSYSAGGSDHSSSKWTPSHAP